MGTVFIKNLPVECVVGIEIHERSSRQRLLISVELTADFAKAAASERLEDTLDYTAIARHIEGFARNGQFRLIETLAEHLAGELLVAPVTRVVVEIEKPAALASTREVGVRVVRGQVEP